MLLALLATPVLSGCAIGLPHGPLEPSVTADCVNYLNENWLAGDPCAGGVCDAPTTQLEAAVEPALACEPAGRVCRDCPLIPHADIAPPYIDPGPPGRFLPVPVRPVFAPQPVESPYFYAAPAR